MQEVERVHLLEFDRRHLRSEVKLIVVAKVLEGDLSRLATTHPAVFDFGRLELYFEEVKKAFKVNSHQEVRRLDALKNSVKNLLQLRFFQYKLEDLYR